MTSTTALDAADLLTVRYAANLPLLLASSPRLSSQLAQTRPTPLGTPITSANDANRYTRCTACGAETIGGISGSYWLENGYLVGHCVGCSRSTVRRERGQSSHTTTTNEGKTAFERVKKRRRTAGAAAAMTLERRRQVADDEILHPTALLAKRRADPFSSASDSRGASRSVSATPAASPSADNASASGTTRPGSTLTPDASSSSSAKRSKPNSASARSLASSSVPTDSARPTPDSQHPSRGLSARLPPTPLAAVSRPSSSRSESPAFSASSQTASATPRPGSGSDSSTSSATAATAAAAKKRKRPKQPSGLAGLLAQKKERELASTNAARGAGGLMDFLQEL